MARTDLNCRRVLTEGQVASGKLRCRIGTHLRVILLGSVVIRCSFKSVKALRLTIETFGFARLFFVLFAFSATVLKVFFSLTLPLIVFIFSYILAILILSLTLALLLSFLHLVRFKVTVSSVYRSVLVTSTTGEFVALSVFTNSISRVVADVRFKLAEMAPHTINRKHIDISGPKQYFQLFPEVEVSF